MTTILRPYQKKAADQIRAHAAKGGKGAILKMATGSGKTAVFCDFLIGAHKKGNTAIMVVKGKSLVAQASERLRREGVPHGILQGDNTRGTHHKILVCSIDTLFARQLAPKADLVVIDECHMSHSTSYAWFFEQYPNVFKIGVSATPNHKKGMTHIADAMIEPVTIRELIDDGYLVGGKYYVPYIPDLTGVGKANGDYKTGDLADASIADKELAASAAKVWKENLQGKSTLVYAVNIEHAGVVATSLAEAGAIVAVLTGSSSDCTRKDVLGKLLIGEINAVVSVGVLTTGVDLPALQAIMCCRPTESHNLWIQILGRGTRPYLGKKHFLVYDLSGNLLKHGPIEQEFESNLYEIDVNEKPKIASIKLTICAKCYATFENVDNLTTCPCCGEPLDPKMVRTTGKRRTGLGDNAEVVEYIQQPWEQELARLVAVAKKNGLKKGFVYHRISDIYGKDIADLAWPRIRSLKKWPVKPPTGVSPAMAAPYNALSEIVDDYGIKQNQNRPDAPRRDY